MEGKVWIYLDFSFHYKLCRDRAYFINRGQII